MELSTAFGVLGVIANALWPLIKRRKFLLLGQVIACICMFVHFWLLGAHTGAAVMAVAGLLATLAIPLETHPKFKSIYLFSLLLIPLVSWFTWHGLPSVFSTFALVFYCIGNLQVNTKHLRLFLLCCLFCWVGHNLLISSYPALASNFLALCTSLYALAREFNNSTVWDKTVETETAALTEAKKSIQVEGV
jgi:hypothetical protein